MSTETLNRTTDGRHHGHVEDDEALRRRLIELHNHPGMIAEPEDVAPCAVQWAAAGVGGLLLAVGLSRRSWPGLLVAGFGGALIYRSLSEIGGGHDTAGCLGSSNRPDPVVHRNITDESSWESFPASDSPAVNKFTAF